MSGKRSLAPIDPDLYDELKSFKFDMFRKYKKELRAIGVNLNQQHILDIIVQNITPAHFEKMFKKWLNEQGEQEQELKEE
jgi:hypothetical protein